MSLVFMALCFCFHLWRHWSILLGTCSPFLFAVWVYIFGLAPVQIPFMFAICFWFLLSVFFWTFNLDFWIKMGWYNDDFLIKMKYWLFTIPWQFMRILMHHFWLLMRKIWSRWSEKNLQPHDQKRFELHRICWRFEKAVRD